MEQDLVSAEFSAEDLTVLNTSLTAMKGKLPFLLSLSAQEKKSLFKVEENYKPFIQLAFQAVDAHPEIMPQVFNTAEFKKDYNLFYSLEPVRIQLNELAVALDDTVTAAGSDTLIASLEIYNSVKDNAAKVPGLQAIYDEMKQYFPRKRKPQNPPTGQ